MKIVMRRRFIHRLILGLFVIAACCLPATGAQAGIYYWDTNGATLALGLRLVAHGGVAALIGAPVHLIATWQPPEW